MFTQEAGPRVMQCIREYLDAALVLHRNDDDDLEAMLREGGEGDVWRLIQKMRAAAGMQSAWKSPMTQTRLHESIIRNVALR